MFCVQCGRELPNDARFCDACGADTGAGSAQTRGFQDTKTETVAQEKPKSKLRTVGIVAAVLLVIAIIYYAQAGNAYVEAVKTSSPILYQHTTYGEAFDNFFSSPEWRYFTSDTGSKIVEFTGGCLVNGRDADVLIQFTVNSDANMAMITYCSVDGVGQNLLDQGSLLAAIFT